MQRIPNERLQGEKLTRRTRLLLAATWAIRDEDTSCAARYIEVGFPRSMVINGNLDNIILAPP